MSHLETVDEDSETYFDHHPKPFVNQESEESDIEEDPEPYATPERTLLWACNKGLLAEVEKVLSILPSAVSATDSDGYTPLHRASYGGYCEILKLLLQHSASVQAKTEDGWTPLHSACRWNQYQCVQTLIDAGADINAVTNSGQTPLHLAATNSTAGETLQLLLMNPILNFNLKNNNGETAKDLAFRSGPFSYLFEITSPIISMSSLIES